MPKTSAKKTRNRADSIRGLGKGKDTKARLINKKRAKDDFDIEPNNRLRIGIDEEEKLLDPEKITEEDVEKVAEKMAEEAKATGEAKEEEAAPEDPERQEISEDMAEVSGLAFTPVVRRAERTGFFAKLGNRFKVAARWIWSATIGALITGVSLAITAPEKLFFEGKRKASAQEERSHEFVPGRGDERFEEEDVKDPETGEDKEVYSDTRRVPLVWERMTAGDAEAEPEITVMVEQGQRGDAKAMSGGEFGHAMIGLSYGRYNRSTNRRERYALQMGFYPAGGIVNKSGTLMMIGGATVPGQLRDDYRHHYDVARRYSAKPGDVNKILRASETYADGGYGYFKRNCTTFMVEMARKANLPIGSEAEYEEMRFGGIKAVAAELAAGTSMAGYFGAANTISEKLNKQDLSYANFGQNMYTKRDLDRYYDTAINSEVIRKGYAPSGVGEVMRYSESGGDLGALYEEDKKVSFKEIGKRLNDSGDEIVKLLSASIPQDKINKDDSDMAIELQMAGDFGFGALINTEGDLSTTDIKKCHKEVTDMMKRLNTYYVTRLGRDARFNMLIMKHLSLLEQLLGFIDTIYQSEAGKDMKGDMGTQRARFLNDKASVISFSDEENNFIQTRMSGAMYEGYLMAGLSPQDAIKKHARLIEIASIPEEERNGAEKKEFTKLELYHSLALDFSRANRRMLEKEQYSSKDISYAFTELPGKERGMDNAAGGELLNYASASIIYQGLILEKIFGGFREKHIDNLSDYNEQAGAVDEYLSEKTEGKEEQLLEILTAFMKGQKSMNEDALAAEFMSLLQYSYFIPAYEGSKLSKLDWDPIVSIVQRKNGFYSKLVALFNKILPLREQAA